MPTIDLNQCLSPKSDVLIGYEYGQRVRNQLGLDQLDAVPEVVTVSFPGRLDLLAPSFAQGFFGKSVLRLGRDQFYVHYDFSGWPGVMRDQVETGVQRALMNREEVIG